MNDTTTPVDGVASDAAVASPPAEEATQPSTEAVDDTQVSDASQTPSADEAVSEDSSQSSQAQAELGKDELTDWLQKKGLEINFENPNEVKLANMQFNAEKKMHEATQKPSITPPEPVAETGDDTLDELVARQNKLELQTYVRDWFETNPEMKEHRSDLKRIADEKPWLQNMDDVKAHFLADPNRTEQLKQDGGREALTNLAQKQQGRPPVANATNSADYTTGKITSENVDQLVVQNDMEWYKANREEILRASNQM